MFESSKRDVTADVILVTSYPNTFRRRLIDFAVKIVKHRGKVTMKVGEIIMSTLRLKELWEGCQRPLVIQFV